MTLELGMSFRNGIIVFFRRNKLKTDDNFYQIQSKQCKDNYELHFSEHEYVKKWKNIKEIISETN